jgi:aldose 1-epimerase
MTPFGKLPDGRGAHLFTLAAASGVRVDVTDYGGIVVRVLVPDRTGRLADVALGFPSVERYVPNPAYLGAIVGRVANRIARGRFTLDGRTYVLATNDAPGGVPCHLHGGVRGFDQAVWAAEQTTRGGRPALRLRHTSPDGDEGYPGTLEVEVVYALTADGALRVDYAATTDRATPVALTNHTYWNLRGEGDADVLAHVLTLQASRYTPVDVGLIPTGALAAVAGTPFDFTTPHAIGARVDADDPQLRFAGGYDHNFVLDGPWDGSDGFALAARVHEPASGRVLEVRTTEPGVQLYSGNFLDGSLVGKSGRGYGRRSALCLETQHFPDSPNHPGFPSIVLRPGRPLRSTTVFRFSTD